MSFPNALEGVKKIYKAEIIELISGILAVVAAFFGILAIASVGAGSDEGLLVGALSGGVLLIAVAVLSIIAFVMNIIGLVKAKADEDNFKIALYVVIVGIAAAIVISCTEAGTLLNDLGETCRDICSFLTTWYVCTAIINLADRLGNKIMKDKATNVRKLLLIIWILSILLDVIGTIFGRSIDSNSALGMVVNVIGLVAAILAIVNYVLYLRLLSKSRTMLEA